ncbi:MAG: pentapeptide repeat-containing protein [Oscillatoria sp. PMC 1076.18]|nr:pentapeptide repeat-containing protein [Oscillatoria sp. PMC 1076.18]
MTTPTTSESIQQLVTTGKAKNGNFEGVDIIKALEDAGAASFNDGEQKYYLTKFNTLDLEGANLKNAKLKFLSAKKINLRNANLNLADISNNWWDEADFSAASLHRADLSRSIMKGANFEKSSSGALELLGGDFTNANFKDAEMDGVDMRAANFTAANFENAIIDSDGPYDPHYLGANFTDANFKGAKIFLTEFVATKNSASEGDVIERAMENIILCRTIMPDGTINNRDCKS